MVFLLAVVLFINYVDRGALPTAAHLIQDDLHLNEQQLGLLFSAFFWTYTLVQIPMGWLAERYGAHRVLASGLAGGAIVALGFTLVASVRRRRRELALLKALGFTQRQLAATISWQASVAGVVGVVVGLPLGIALGRWLWSLFAAEVFAVPRPSVPVGSLVLVAVGALALVNVVAALPGLSAARTRIALVLRAE